MGWGKRNRGTCGVNRVSNETERLLRQSKAARTQTTCNNNNNNTQLEEEEEEIDSLLSISTCNNSRERERERERRTRQGLQVSLAGRPTNRQFQHTIYFCITMKHLPLAIGYYYYYYLENIMLSVVALALLNFCCCVIFCCFDWPTFSILRESGWYQIFIAAGSQPVTRSTTPRRRRSITRSFVRWFAHSIDGLWYLHSLLSSPKVNESSLPSSACIATAIAIA